jgi:predicted DsbA family dithiol-disulfide isomerase
MEQATGLRPDMPAEASKIVKIDVVSDTICPWCFVGKRRLEKALALLPAVHTSVRWRPFLLDSTIPEGGMDRQDYLVRKFGAEGAKTVHNRVRAAGAEEGIQFEFEKITRTPNTIDSHRLLHWAEESGKQSAVAERLFKLYFQEGEDIGDRNVLAGAAADCGMDAASVRKRLDSAESRSIVLRQIQEANDFGIDGVPCFVFDAFTYLPGAQSAEVITHTINRMLAAA